MSSRPAPQDMHATILSSLDNSKAVDVVSIDLAGKSSIADFMVIAAGTSVRHVGAISDNLLKKLKGAGVKGVSVEGRNNSDWVLIDAGDIIVHLFRVEVRLFYNLEKLWADMPAETAGVSAIGA